MPSTAFHLQSVTHCCFQKRGRQRATHSAKHDVSVLLARALQAALFPHVRLLGARTRVLRERPANQLLQERGERVPVVHVCIGVKVGCAQDCSKGSNSNGSSCSNSGRIEYLVDVGNGRPYFTPLRMPSSSLQHCSSSSSRVEATGCSGGGNSALHVGCEYRVRRNADAPHDVVVEHRRPGRREEWVENYRVDLRHSLSAEEAEAVRQRHRTDPHFGHLLHSLRLNKWAREGCSIVLEDATLCRLRPDGTEEEGQEICSGDELLEVVRGNFGAAFSRQLIPAAPWV